jgi:hypothetical protein
MDLMNLPSSHVNASTGAQFELACAHRNQQDALQNVEELFRLSMIVPNLRRTRRHAFLDDA